MNVFIHSLGSRFLPVPYRTLFPCPVPTLQKPLLWICLLLSTPERLFIPYPWNTHGGLWLFNQVLYVTRIPQYNITKKNDRECLTTSTVPRLCLPEPMTHISSFHPYLNYLIYDRNLSSACLACKALFYIPTENAASVTLVPVREDSLESDYIQQQQQQQKIHQMRDGEASSVGVCAQSNFNEYPQRVGVGRFGQIFALAIRIAV